MGRPIGELCRITGVGGEYAGLLEYAGIDTVKALHTGNADNLAAELPPKVEY